MSELGEQRHRARERAFEILYEWTIKNRPIPEILNSLPIQPDPYTTTLVRAVETHREWAEAKLSEHSIQWPLGRMPIVDRLIMTMALCELQLDDAPPRAVVFDEAVELAKIYSSDSAPAFVNGLLTACVSANE